MTRTITTPEHWTAPTSKRLEHFLDNASNAEHAFFDALPADMDSDKKLGLLYRFRTEYADYQTETAYYRAWSEAVNMVNVDLPAVTTERTHPDCEFCELGTCVQEVVSFRDAQ